MFYSNNSSFIHTHKPGEEKTENIRGWASVKSREKIPVSFNLQVKNVVTSTLTGVVCVCSLPPLTFPLWAKGATLFIIIIIIMPWLFYAHAVDAVNSYHWQRWGSGNLHVLLVGPRETGTVTLESSSTQQSWTCVWLLTQHFPRCASWLYFWIYMMLIAALLQYYKCLE